MIFYYVFGGLFTENKYFAITTINSTKSKISLGQWMLNFLNLRFMLLYSIRVGQQFSHIKFSTVTTMDTLFPNLYNLNRTC